MTGVSPDTQREMLRFLKNKEKIAQLVPSPLIATYKVWYNKSRFRDPNHTARTDSKVIFEMEEFEA